MRPRRKKWNTSKAIALWRLTELNIVVALYTEYICLYVCKLGILVAHQCHVHFSNVLFDSYRTFATRMVRYALSVYYPGTTRETLPMDLLSKRVIYFHSIRSAIYVLIHTIYFNPRRGGNPIVILFRLRSQKPEAINQNHPLPGPNHASTMSHLVHCKP